MKFSIVIPSYGQAQYLPEAIESAIDQTYRNIEIIIVDDGSTDGSLAIAKNFEQKARDKYIDYRVVSQVNKGLASARNTGIMNATGDYVFFLDADDVMDETCIEFISEKAYKTHADVIVPSIYCFGVSSGAVFLMDNPEFKDFKEGNRLAYCAAIKRSALLETGGYSPKMDRLGGWEDLHLWYDMMHRGKKIVTISELLVWYRTKEQSMWKNTIGKEKQLWEQIIKDFPEAKEHEKVQ